MVKNEELKLSMLFFSCQIEVNWLNAKFCGLTAVAAVTALRCTFRSPSTDLIFVATSKQYVRDGVNIVRDEKTPL